MKSDTSTGRITISGVPDSLKHELDTLADAEGKSRSEKVVELIRDEVGNAVPNEKEEFLPANDTLRTIYKTLLELGRMPDHTIRFDIHGGEVAQKAGLSQSAIRGNLFRLQSRGYVKHQRTKDATAQHGEMYHIKPRCANPRSWRYSEVRDPEVVNNLERRTTDSQLEADTPQPIEGESFN